MNPPAMKPCPFCGGEGQVIRTKDLSGYWYSECKKCYMRHLAYSKDPQEAADRWNTRSSPLLTNVGSFPKP